MMKEIITESRNAGVSLFVLQCFVDEICGHLDVAKRTVDDCGGDLQSLSEIVTVWGKHANCFIQGYLNTLEPSEINAGTKVSDASVKWEDYWHKYSPSDITKKLHNFGVAVVPTSLDEFITLPEFREVLKAIVEEWGRRKPNVYPRATVLNQNEAIQFCFLYHRRRELKASGLSPEVWFLSFETLLAIVFARNAGKWELPPTFPFSAWVVFLDSRLPHSPKNPAAIVNAILKGNPEAFDVPDPVSLVRSKAFGDRVPTKVEEDAMQLQLSSFNLIQRVERARAAVLSRGRQKGATEESREARRVAVGEIAKEMGETILRLQEELAKQRALLKVQADVPKQVQIIEEPKSLSVNSKPYKVKPKTGRSAKPTKRRF
jgi:hypothetical protein